MDYNTFSSVYDGEKNKKLEKRIKELEEGLKLALMIIGHASVDAPECGPWCNGVHSDQGDCEGHYLLDKSVEDLKKLVEE